MAANIYNPVPVPVGDGTGAPVSIIGQGLKTFVIGGTFDATVIVEVGIGGNFAPLYILDKPNQFRDVPVVAEDVRVRVVNHRSGQATVIIGGAPTPNIFAALVVPAGNGVGAALDTSVWGGQKTLIAGGVFDATLTYEVSEDAAGPFSPLGSDNGPTNASLDKTANILNVDIINRFVRVRVTNYKSGAPTVGVGAAELGGGGGGTSASNCLVYQQGGGQPGPVIFDDWDALYIQLQVLRLAANGGGCYDVVIDTTQSVATPIPGECSVAASATIYDLEGVRLLGLLGAGGVLHFDDGAHVINMRYIGNFLQVDNFNTAVALETIPAGAISLLTITDGCTLQSVNGSLVGAYDLSLSAFFIARIEGASRLSFFRTGTVFANVAVGATLAFQIFDANPVQNPLGQNNTISGAAGSTMFLQMENTKAWRNPGTLFLGTVFAPQITEPAFLTPKPFQLPPSAVAVTALFGEHLYLDATAAPIAQPLPSMSGTAFPFPGGFMAISDSGDGSNIVTVTPGAGDTIQGAASFLLPGGGSVLLAGDGVSNWTILGVFDPLAVSGAVNSRGFIFQEGGGGIGPVVFGTWAGLDFVLQAKRAAGGPAPGGLFTIQIDDSVVTPCVIPARVAPYDLTNTELIGRSELGAFGANTRLDFADGTTFIGLRSFRRNLGIVSLNTVTIPDSSLSGAETISLQDNCFINTPSATGIPIWDAAGVTASDFVLFQLDAGCFINFNFGGGLSNGPVIDLPTAGSTIVLNAKEGSGVPFVGITGIASTVLFLQVASTRNVPNVNTGFLGTVLRPGSTTIPSSLAPNPWYTAAANIAALPAGGVRPGGWYRFDASGGPIAQSLPAISGFANNYKQPGVLYAFTEESGSVGLTLVPGPGDTINGSLVPYVVPPGGGVIIMEDGISNAEIVGFFDPTLAPPSQLVYQPGGTGVGPVVFSSWAAVNSRLAIIKAVWGNAEIKLSFDDSIVSPIPIPVGGPYDMTRVVWTGSNIQGIGNPVFITIPEGVTFTGLREFEGFIRVTNLATVTVPDTSLADGDNITVRGAAHIDNTGAVALWAGTALLAGDIVFAVMEERGAFGFNAVPTSPILDISVAGTTLLGGAFDNGLIRDDCLAGPAGATLLLAPIGSASQVREDQSTFLGTVTSFVRQFTRYETDTALRVASGLVREQELARFDTTAGNLIGTLPAFGSQDMFRGQVVAVKNEVGTNTVIVTPSGADTIDSVAAPLILYPGQAAILSWNGVSNWTAFHIDNNGVGKHLFITAASQSPQTQGDHIGSNIGVNGSGNVEFHIPDDFNTLIGAQVLVISGGTLPAADIDLNSDYGGIGELFNANSESDVASTFALVINQINEIDISTVLTGVAKDDTVGVELDNNNVTGGYLVLGVHLSYL